ncbi:MAG: response regulator transcription factor [Melioribacteraceae bacterium]|nr:response regulator transcription factor [Melioribacteraceae bacterium]
MSRKIINIALLEPSQIVNEGLTNLFMKSGQYFKLFRVENFDELEKLMEKEIIDIALVNPSFIQNRDKEFITLKKNNHTRCWIALVYTFFNQQILSLFDNTINITDSPDTIIKLVNKLFVGTSENQMQNMHEQLSEREIEVLKLVVSGMSNKEIADKLFISVHTVVSHRKNISQKTGIKSQSGLTIYAISNKIIQLDNFSNQ